MIFELIGLFYFMNFIDIVGNITKKFVDTVKNNDSFQTKSEEHFEESKFSVGDHQFLMDSCLKLIETHNFGQNAVNERQFKNKNEQYCVVWLFNFKVAETFCQFSVRDCQYFLPWKS
jgi:hypothetical protein